MSRKIIDQTFFQNHDRHDHRNGVWQTIENVYSTDVSIFTFISAFLKKKLRNQHMTTMMRRKHQQLIYKTQRTTVKYENNVIHAKTSNELMASMK
jgi:hypothetical protein